MMPTWNKRRLNDLDFVELPQLLAQRDSLGRALKFYWAKKYAEKK